MDDPLAKLMGGLRIDDESFNEVMLESDEETEKKSNIEPETHPSIDNWISKVALKSKFEIILAILRCHFKDEKVSCWSMSSDSNNYFVYIALGHRNTRHDQWLICRSTIVRHLL